MGIPVLLIKLYLIFLTYKMSETAVLGVAGCLYARTHGRRRSPRIRREQGAVWEGRICQPAAVMGGIGQESARHANVHLRQRRASVVRLDGTSFGRFQSEMTFDDLFRDGA